MFDRRSLLLAICSLMSTQPALSQEGDLDIERLVQDLISDQNSVLTLGQRILPPEDPAWREAYRILKAAPTGTTPYEVAEYFRKDVPAKFTQAWPELNANPIIVEFFWEMHDHPKGDQTPWCSAFVNFCLRRSSIKGTDEAGSQSFIWKNWGTEIWKKSDGRPGSAKTGDVAIFRHQSDPEHGHVAFFKEISETQPDHIEVLGGNQIRSIDNRKVHLIDQVSMNTRGDLELFSIRTTAGLRKA